jgi:asparagine synthase (glutamine-hydrolysing)
MCGVFGGIRLDGVVVDEAAVRAASERLRLRGPDDEGIWRDRGVVLGHRRLSIIDLSSAAHQPMLSADGRFVIVYNGEIYNYRDLRQQIPFGYPWRSNSDTEVILAAYRTWGEGCLDRLNGMFAFAIWDCHEKRLFAARDRIGVKPFYFACAPNVFYFASRPRALLSLDPAIDAGIDAQALRLYLESGYVPAPYSIHRGLRKLSPGHFLTFDAGGLRVKPYWTAAGIATDETLANRSENDLLDELEALISDSVRLRLVSDVPLGAFLSGGIDSSLVVAMMTRHARERVNTFTIGFGERAYDESSAARAVANALDTNHREEQLVADDLLQLLPTFFGAFDEPFFDSSAFPVMAVARLARQHVTVALSGDGGDELFGGYHYYVIAAWLRNVYRLPIGVRRVAGRLLRLIPRHRAVLLAAAIEKRHMTEAFCFMRSVKKDFPSVLAREVVDQTAGLSDLFEAIDRRTSTEADPIERFMRMDLSLTLPDDYLQKVDVATMAFSLEARDPFLDYRLVEWAARVPASLKIRGGTNKYLLRKLAFRLLGRRLMDRPKAGFSVPISQWLRGPLLPWAREQLEDPHAMQELMLDQAAVGKLLDVHVARARDVHPYLWAILMLLGFYRQWKTGNAGVVR